MIDIFFSLKIILFLKAAADAKDKLFIATPCCVQAMENIWFDKLNPEQSRTRDQVALTASVVTLGLTAPPFVTFRESKAVRTDFF
jgi:glycerol-3-phosphate acyltransferase PlsY